jgi:hypothetical protein
MQHAPKSTTEWLVLVILPSFATGGFWWGIALVATHDANVMLGAIVALGSMALLTFLAFSGQIDAALRRLFERFSGRVAKEVTALEESFREDAAERERRGYKLGFELAGQWRKLKAIKFEHERIPREILETCHRMIDCLRENEKRDYNQQPIFRAHSRIFDAVENGTIGEDLEESIRVFCARFKVNL